MGINPWYMILSFSLKGQHVAKEKKEGGSAPSSDLPRKGTSPLDPIILNPNVLNIYAPLFMIFQ